VQEVFEMPSIEYLDSYYKTKSASKTQYLRDVSQRKKEDREVRSRKQ
jgi:hypothetical protein